MGHTPSHAHISSTTIFDPHSWASLHESFPNLHCISNAVAKRVPPSILQRWIGRSGKSLCVRGDRAVFEGPLQLSSRKLHIFYAPQCTIQLPFKDRVIIANSCRYLEVVVVPASYIMRADFTFCVNLKVIDLSFNNLSTFSLRSGDLYYLNLAGNPLEELSLSVANIEYLDLSQSMIRNLPPVSCHILRLALCSGLEVNLQTIFCFSPQIEVLDLTLTNVFIDSNITVPSTLTRICLDRCRGEVAPVGIEKLKSQHLTMVLPDESLFVHPRCGFQSHFACRNIYPIPRSAVRGDFYRVSTDFHSRIRKMIFGAALGDALGNSAEFMTSSQAQFYLDMDMTVPAFCCDEHRSSFLPMDWTDDTDQQVLLMRSLINHFQDGADLTLTFAENLREWVRFGFRELNDGGGTGCGGSTGRTVRDPHYLEDPFAAAVRVWEASGRSVSANGAVMRTAIVGSIQDRQLVMALSLAHAKATHADPRAHLAVLVVSLVVHGVLHNRDVSPIFSVTLFNDLVEHAISDAAEFLSSDQPIVDECRRFAGSPLSEMDLEHNIGYCFKTMGAGLAAAREYLSGISRADGSSYFVRIMRRISLFGGDTDTNCAVAGALIGSMDMSWLPKEKIEMLPFYDWLENEIEDYCKKMAIILNTGD